MFIGPFDQYANWNTDSIIGPRRFLERVWKLQYGVSVKKSSKDVEKILHKTIKKISDDIENMRFNTAISSMMIFVGEVDSLLKSELNVLNKNDYKKFLQLLAPFAPHIAEEIWIDLGEKKTIHQSAWPKFDTSMVVEDELKIIIQVNGKMRGEIFVLPDISEDEIKEKALGMEFVSKFVEGNPIKKVIYVKGRLINIVF